MTVSPDNGGIGDTPPKHHLVLYTCYYSAPEPLNPDVFGAARGHFPCFIFSDDPTLPVPDGVTLVHDPLLGLDPNRASRRAKLMPDRYLPPTNWSIYLDNNMRLIADPEDLIKHVTSQGDHPIYVTRHPERDCTYKEAEVCKSLNVDAPARIDEQMKHYESLGFRRKAGLLHGGFLIRNHNHPKLSALGRAWFEQVLRHSRRDQLSFAFVADALGVEPDYMANNFNGQPIFDWPVYAQINRRDAKMRPVRRKSYWSRVIKPILRKLRNKPTKPDQNPNDIELANKAVADLYRDKIGTLVAEPKGDGVVLVKYEKDHGFDYETYREIQNVGNKLKLDYQWVGREQIKFIAELIKEFGPEKVTFGLCHGTRRGNEQLWLTECLGGNPNVIGTEIADSATEFPNTVQWDFHKVNPEWVGAADFVYSNSWDHSYDPELAFGVWINSLRSGGLLILDWTEGHSESGVTEMDPFGASLAGLQALLDRSFANEGNVVACRKGDCHQNQQIWTIVYRKF